MSDIGSLRPVARWLSALLLAGMLCPRVAARAAAAETTAAPTAPGAGSVVVLDTTADQVVLSVGEREGITPGTEFRVVRGQQEVARVRVTEVFPGTARARVVSGLPAGQLRLNDRAEMIGAPPQPPRRGGKFPWGVVVGAGILTLVVIGLARDSDGSTAGVGVADVTVR